MATTDPHATTRRTGATRAAITVVAGICVVLVVAGVASFVVRGSRST